MVLVGDVYRISLLVVCGVVVCTAGGGGWAVIVLEFGLHEKGPPLQPNKRKEFVTKIQVWLSIKKCFWAPG